jgi:hypothetical protein
MSTYSTKEVVENMLHDMREALAQGKYNFIKRSKNMESLTQLGLVPSDIIDEINELTYADYISGPETDRDRPDDDKLWIFKKRVISEVFYIKLKVEYQTDKGVRVLSFHIDEHK